MDEVFYNRHYIIADPEGRITDGWSDGPHRGRDTAGAVLLTDQGGYQFRLDPEGEENPALFTGEGIPLYRWDGERIVPRWEAEIAQERPDPVEAARSAKLEELSAACAAAVTAGCHVSLPGGGEGHISLTGEDQINLTAACAAVEAGAEAYPYHLDGQLCALYSGEDILAMGRAATAHKLYHTTRFNHLAQWVRGCGTAEEVQAITYGADLPEELAAHMAAILAAAGGEHDVV